MTQPQEVPMVQRTSSEACCQASVTTELGIVPVKSVRNEA